MKWIIKFKTIKARLTFWLLIVAVLPLIATGIIISQQRVRVIKENSFEKLTAIRDLKAERLNTWLDKRTSDIKIISEDKEIMALSKIFNAPEHTENGVLIIRNATASLNRYVVEYKAYEEIFIINAHSKKTELSTDKARIGSDKSQDTYFTEPMRTQNIYIKDIYYSETTRKPAMTFSIPIFDKEKSGSITGILVVRINLELSLYDLLLNRTGMGNTGETLIVNKDGIALNELRRYPNAPLKLKIEAKPILMASQGKTGITETIDYRGEPILVAYTYIPGTQWGFVAKQDLKEVYEPVRAMLLNILIVVVICVIFVYLLAFFVAKNFARPVQEMMELSRRMQEGDLSARNNIRSEDELGLLAQSFNYMAGTMESQILIQKSVADLSMTLMAFRGMQDFAEKLLKKLIEMTGSSLGAFHLLTEDGKKFKHLASIGISPELLEPFDATAYEGELGKAVAAGEISWIKDIPEDTVFKFKTFTGTLLPKEIITTPIVVDDKVVAVISLASLNPYSKDSMEILNQAWMAMNMALSNLMAGEKTEKLADELGQKNYELEAQSEELQSQSEALRTLNEELEEQTQALEASEQKLKVQQEELEVSNEELMEQNKSLEQQKKEIEKTRKAMEQKAEELAIAGKYKSEFLANMSHELRTPLNSLLLLSSILFENKEGNLTPDQLESIQVIYQSGNDLLSLINEILDLAKIESGRMDLQSRDIVTRDIADSIVTNFQHMAEAKKLNLAIHMADMAPVTIYSDQKCVVQILKNLISNAIKFTEKGSITVDFGLPPDNADLSRSGLDRINTLAIAVKDTGIGISPENQKVVFEAFQQVEGGTARQYGGTGLGLSISRELARLLGGEIYLTSEKGKGSVFTLYLPVTPKAVALPMSTQGVDDRPPQPDSRIKRTQQQVAAVESILDDRDTLGKNEKTILVVEDDPKFARLLLKLCHERGLKCLATPLGEEGLILAEKYMPQAIILDIKLPGMDGWAVLENLKENPKIRHIPVHIMSVEEPTMEAFRKGAVGYLKKPINKAELDEAFHKLTEVFSKEVKNLLVVEDDENLRKSIIKLLGNGDVHAEQVATGTDAIRILKSKVFDCMILDLGLPDMTGFELLKALEADEEFTMPPVIVYTGRDLSRKEDEQLREYAESIIIKGVKSEERLLDEASLFLHRIVSKLPEKKRQMIASLHDTDALFKDKTVLVVDDDMRNVFALSRLLEDKGMHVLKAENGQKALDVLKTAPVVDLVLMDIMMPIMDGYETMKRIRAQEIFQKLPIIALTAKAMKEDKSRCIAAGASDYLAKPVDGTRLSSMMRVWLYR